MNLSGKHIIISRTDSIGDVMLTLPVCAWLKNRFEDCRITFLGKGYTRAVVEAYAYVDAFEDWNDYLNTPKTEKIQNFRALNADAIVHVFPDKEIASLAKKARIPVRIGTSHRAYHLLTCSHRVNFTRKNSDLHESQLNFELLRPVGLKQIPSLDAIVSFTEGFQPDTVELPNSLTRLSEYTILHPKSQGSAREWPIEKYMQLASRLVNEGKTVVFTGTDKEGELFRNEIPQHDNIVDSTGKLTLEQLMTLIKGANNLVACSTGPLHIAGYCGINTVGLFSPKRPIHPGRWKALGPKVRIVVHDESCEACNQGKECNCIEKIDVETVYGELQ